MTDHILMEKFSANIYTCREYREEMILAGLKKRLAQTGLSERERSEIEKEIHRIEKVMDF
jgi:hypothetical protein